MEDKSHSPTEEPKRSLTFFLEASSNSFKMRLSKSGFSFINSQNASNHALRVDANSLTIFKDSSFFSPKLASVSLESDLSFLYGLLFEQENVLELNKSVERKITLKMAKVSHSFLKNDVVKALFSTDLFPFFKKITDTMDNHCTLSSFAKTLFDSTPFSIYQSCQFFIHQKGKLKAESCFFNKIGPIEENTLDVQTFNKLFKTIKKSKNKLFSQSQILLNEIKVMGTFQAKEFNFKSHSFILLVSHDGFLFPSEHDLRIFDLTFKELTPYINTFLDIRSTIQSSQKLRSFIKNFKYPICCSRNFEQELTKSKVSNSSQLNFSFVHKDFKISYYSPLKSTLASDIHHHQRISLLGELLNTLKHELSNPLFGLKLSNDLALTENLGPEIDETLNDIALSCTRCHEIIKSFSNLYQSDEAYSKFDLYKLIQETLLLTKSESRMIIKCVKSNFLTDRKNHIINSNPTWVSQIFFNLIINSAQALLAPGSSVASPRIDITLENHKDYILILVSDNGPGIDESIRLELFEPFITTKKEGTGLGLSICKRLLDKLGGNIDLKTQSDCGTTFSIKLPKSNYEDTTH